MITTKQFNVTEADGYKHLVWGVLYVPDNVFTVGLPLILFAHGRGEKSSSGPIDIMFQQGLPYALKNGFVPPFNFVMIALQHSSWSPTPQWNASIIDEAVKLYGIDKSNVLLTGLSAGGQTTYDSQLTPNSQLASKFKAIAPLSAATGSDLSFISTFLITKTPVWATCGAVDSMGFEPYNANIASKINAIVPGLCTYTKIPNVGHSGWIDIYNGKTKDVNGGTIWDFFKRVLGNVAAPPPVIVPPVIIPPVVVPPAKKAINTITLYDDNSYTIV